MSHDDWAGARTNLDLVDEIALETALGRWTTHQFEITVRVSGQGLVLTADRWEYEPGYLVRRPTLYVSNQDAYELALALLHSLARAGVKLSAAQSAYVRETLNGTSDQG